MLRSVQGCKLYFGIIMKQIYNTIKLLIDAGWIGDQADSLSFYQFLLIIEQHLYAQLELLAFLISSFMLPIIRKSSGRQGGKYKNQ
ncbi:Uncharacterised protein [Mycobacteroides abscessus subsp. abscessus]|nr:Uncharacterised protein [Mycobacteroides abscessus subsp. abscessus]